MPLKPTNRMNKKSKNINNFASLFKRKSIEDRLFEANNLINFVELKKDRSALPELELAIKLLKKTYWIMAIARPAPCYSPDFFYGRIG